MFDFNPLPGAEKKWHDKDGRLLCVLRAFKKRRNKGGKKKSSMVIRIMSPDEYESLKLTNEAKK